jgi:ribosomal protein L31E
MQVDHTHSVEFYEQISVRTGRTVNPVRNSIARNNTVQKVEISNGVKIYIFLKG